MIYESLIYSISILGLAVLIDLLIGEVPDKIHPVIYMGHFISKLKNYLPATKTSGLLIILATNFTFSIITLILLLITAYLNNWLYVIIASIILSTTFSINFLIKSVKDIQKDLNEDIDKARQSMSYLVSRDTQELTESRITSAAIETLTENITDSIISPLFYTTIISIPFGMIIAIPCAVIYRVCNTMDAMLGYKTKELIDVGCYPAKLDDILNYIPARIAGYYMILSAYILRYDYKQSYHVMKEFALKTPSPNSGYTMSAAAGALNITLTKEGVYQLGYGTTELTSDKITESIKLTKVTSILFIVTILLVYFIIAMLLL
ncbi:cobalamin biosynthesis protein [Methanosphaera sp. Vir-13MRS]|uniref:cobalamin biosynthesis protein n=1 Tax=Candidatus Methanosphaera massiliense TaxID=3017187 RepID=UPI00237FFCC6|nr:cobalamin biosynthesis protein [Candidatus Methanosphaera massiliense]MDE4077965.1 cobalamin biosynthesis protein [Candidatus Methanosphaera massiliense]